MAAREAATPGIAVSPVGPARAYLALAAGVLCISFTAIFTKWAAVPGPVSAAYRMAISAIVLAIPFVRTTRRRETAGGSAIGEGLVGGIWFAFNLAFLNSALLLTSAATATLLDNTAPIWVGLGATAFFGERLRGRYWLGLVMALIGAAVVTGFHPAAGFSFNQGDRLAFVGATFYAGYLLTTQHARRDLDALSYLWLVVVTAAVLLAGASLAMGLPLFGYPLRSYLSLIALGVLSQTGGWFLINYALGHLPASTAVIVLLAQPVVTGLLSIPLLGEVLIPRQIGGGALVLLGIYLCLGRNGRISNRQISKWVSLFADRWRANDGSRKGIVGIRAGGTARSDRSVSGRAYDVERGDS